MTPGGPLLALLFAAAAAPGLPLDAASPGYPLSSACEVLEDPTRRMELADVLREAARFGPIDASHSNLGYRASTFWFRCRVWSPADAPSPWVVELSTTPSLAALYEPNAIGGFNVRRSGLALPFGQRELPVANIALPLVIAPHVGTTFYLSLQSEDTLMLDGMLRPARQFLENTATRRLLDGLYYGLLLSMIVYNGFVFLMTRDRTYLSYVAFQVVFVATQASLEKHLFQYLWPGHPVWAARSEQVLLSLAAATALRFTAELLQLRSFSRALTLGTGWLSAGALGLAAAGLFTDRSPFKDFLSAYVLACLAAVFVASLAALRAKRAQAPLFLAAWALLLGGAGAGALGAVGLLQIVDTLNVMKVGSAAEALLLSLSLAGRIRGLQEQRERAVAAILDERQARIAGLGRVVASVAHEIGNPLNFAVGGAAELKARAGGLEPPARRALDLVVAGQQRIKDIVDNLRSLGRGVRGEVEAVDVAEEIEATLRLTGEALERAGIRVEKALGPLPRVAARAGELQQVFGNLVLNSIKAMRGGGTLTITAGEEQRQVVVAVEDTGPGVRPEHRALLFEPFFTEPPGEGTGLGLYVSHEIVARNGGSLALAPSERGARFVVTLPQVSAGPASPPPGAGTGPRP